MDTVGGFTTEAESAAEFDRRALATGAWKVYREVEGYPVQPRAFAEMKSLRIDRILTPTDKLRLAGWQHGPVGVELKKSGIKAGPALSQMLDYSRAIWTIQPGHNIALELIFLWPAEKQHGTVASIMQQNRIGTAWYSKWDVLKFYVGEQRLLRFGRNGEIESSSLRSGGKAGAR